MALQNPVQHVHAHGETDDVAQAVAVSATCAEVRSDALCCASAGEGEKWAIQDSNDPRETLKKQHVSEVGAAKCAADSSESVSDAVVNGAAVNSPEPVSSTTPADTDFADAVKAVMALPLTDAEKAEAVRRLLAAYPGREASQSP